MKKRLLLLLLLFLFLGHFKLQAQVKTVTGTITDSQTGETLPGANVALQGTMSAVVSDVTGKYSIQVPDSNAVLVFTYVNYLKETVQVKGQSVINVHFIPDVKQIDEIVVTGYGTQKRGNLTSSQVSISEKAMEMTENTTLEQAIQGRAAGAYITQNSGQPGGGISIAIRGISSINGSTEPLYVIDGVQIAGSQINYGPQSSSDPLSGLNPSDIADIQILQGPSATAVYGTRATNGIVLITTKRGKTGEAKIKYSFNTTIQTPPKHLPLMNLREYAQFSNEYHAAQGGTSPIQFEDPSILGAGTDWQKELFKNATMTQHDLSVSGGNDKNTYFISGQYLNQGGVGIASGFERYSFRVNLDNKPKTWLKISSNVSYSQINENLAITSEGLVQSALFLTPQIPVKNVDGSWGGGSTTDTNQSALQYAPVNPIAIANLVTNKNTKRMLLAGTNLEFNLLKGLVFRTSLNGNMGLQNSQYYIPTYSIGWAVNTTSTLSEYWYLSTYWNLNEMLEYNKQFGKHSFDLMVSHEAQQGTGKIVNPSISGFLTNDVLDFNAGDATTAAVSGGHNSWAIESYLGRINYNFGEAFLFSGTVRADGSSYFGTANKWGYFPAASAAVRITKIAGVTLPQVINELKVRYEIGETGNNGWGSGIYSPMAANVSAWGTGFLPSSYANANVKWEQTLTNNVGLNVNAFNNRAQFEVDAFMKKTSNLLMTAQEPDYMGTSGVGSVSAPTVNVGSMENKGLTLSLTTTNIDNHTFKWESSFNISWIQSKVTKLTTNQAHLDHTASWLGNWTQRSQPGSAPWQFLGYKYDGLFTSVDQVTNSPTPVNSSSVKYPVTVSDIWVGDVKYKDINGDGIIDQNDLTTIGNPWPKFFGGFTNTLTYKGFDLNVLITYSYGNKIFNYVAYNGNNPHNVYIGRNLFKDAANYAKLTTTSDGVVELSNPGATLPRLNTTDENGNWSRFTDRWVEDGSYIKVKNIALGYNLPSSMMSKQKLVTGARVQFSVQNLITLTHYKGMDPEVGSYVGANASSATQPMGIDSGRYPLCPMYSFNVIVNF